MAKIEHKRIKLDEAARFIERYHHHSKPLKRHFFAIGAMAEVSYAWPPHDLRLVGVAQVDNCTSAWSQRYDHLELRRLCIAPHAPPNTASFLVGKVTRACWAMGAEVLVTYTQPYEQGTALLASGWWIQQRGKMVKYESGRMEGGLMRWVTARSVGPDKSDRENTKRIISETNQWWAENNQAA